METDPLLMHLHKLPPPAAAAAAAAEPLSEVLETLWSTRKTGLGSDQKPHIRSLLALPPSQDLDPVLACLRLIIRKFVRENLSTDGIRKLFPPDISIELQNIILKLLQKHQDHWREEASRDQPLWKGTSVLTPAKVSAPPVLTSYIASEIPPPLWPREAGATSYPNSNDIAGPTPSFADSTISRVTSAPLQQDNGPSDSLLTIPRLKSMTWTMENRNLTPSARVAVITLKLQDYTKSPSGETEVKFKLAIDKLEAMLKSMAHISDLLVSQASQRIN